MDYVCALCAGAGSNAFLKTGDALRYLRNLSGHLFSTLHVLDQFNEEIPRSKWPPTFSTSGGKIGRGAPSCSVARKQIRPLIVLK